MSYISNLVHFVWSTAGRVPTIKVEWEERLHAYIGGILNHRRGKLLATGGMEDHLHVLASLPATISLADAAAVMKANSSRFIHDELEDRAFEWQKGYAGFTVSVSMEPAVRNYIKNQKEHHARRTFQGELIALLDRNGVAYDPKYVFL